MKTKYLLITAISLLFSLNYLLAQNQTYQKPDDNSIRVVFYNTENFFDTFHDSLKYDKEFTPDALRKWNFKKYYYKLNHIAKVLIASGEWNSPDIIGLCEMENKLVLSELIHKTPLKKLEYGYIHYDSPDERGLDVALLYKPEVLKVIYSKPIHINFPFDTLMKTRDILYVKGIIFNKDTVHLFVNHWPSRRDGPEETEKKRIVAATILKDKTDSILNLNNDSKIIIMGDLNDEPSDKSISQILNAKCDTANHQKQYLFDLMCELKSKDEYTYFYKYMYYKEKLVFDQFIVSSYLLNKKSKLTITNNKAYIFKPEWILTKDKDNDIKPKSTYTGPRYNAGFSDHLPVYMDMKYSDK